jgi:hypothetical protein
VPLFHTSSISAPRASQAATSRARPATTTPTPTASVAASPSPTATHTRTRRRRAPAASVASSASMLGQRCSGAAASPRSSAARSHPGTERRGSRGFWASIAAVSSSTVAPANGRSPWIASHSATQKL